MPQTTHFLTVAEVAERLRRSPRTIYRYLHEGDLEGSKIKRGWRITQDAVEHLTASAHPDNQVARPAELAIRARACPFCGKWVT